MIRKTLPPPRKKGTKQAKKAPQKAFKQRWAVHEEALDGRERGGRRERARALGGDGHFHAVGEAQRERAEPIRALVEGLAGQCNS